MEEFHYKVIANIRKLAVYHPNGTLLLPLQDSIYSLSTREIVGRSAAWAIVKGYTFGAQAEDLALWAFTCDKQEITTMQFRGGKPAIVYYSIDELEKVLTRLGSKLQEWEEILRFAVRILKV